MSNLSTFIKMVRRNDFVVLDTETTGLHRGEVVQIAIVNSHDDVLLNTLVKPVNSIPPDATAVHGITDQMVASAPTWGQLTDEIEAILRGRDVVVYNAVYDRKMMHLSAEEAGLPKTDWKTFSRWWCAMEAFAGIYGEWNSYHGNYRWQRLSTAARYYRIPVTFEHSALGDARMTLAVVQAMARLGH